MGLNIELFDPKVVDELSVELSEFGPWNHDWPVLALQGREVEAFKALQAARNNNRVNFDHEHALIHALNGNFQYVDHLKGELGHFTDTENFPAHLVFKWLQSSRS